MKFVFFFILGLHLRDLWQEVSDGQNIGSSLQSRPLEQQTVRLHPVRLQGRPEGLAHCPQPFSSREVEALRL